MLPVMNRFSSSNGYEGNLTLFAQPVKKEEASAQGFSHRLLKD
jgi:hypothetical protein